MKYRYSRWLIILLLSLFVATSTWAASSFNTPTGVLKYDKEKAYKGYTLFTPLTGISGAMYTFLIDMNGEVVHTWKFDDAKYTPNYYAILLENGHLLRALRPWYTPEGIPSPSRRALAYYPTGSIFQEVNWDGEIVWEGRHPGHKDVTSVEFQDLTGLSDAQMQDPAIVASTLKGIESKKGIGNDLARKFNYTEHHDMLKIWNKKLQKYTLMFIANKNVSPDDVNNCGFIGKPDDNSFPDSVSVDVIAEIDMETGELLWEWWLWDHIIQNTDPAKPNYVQSIADASYDGNIEEAFYHRIDVNLQSNLNQKSPGKDWAHLNSFDYRADLDLIVLNSRQFGETYIIDHSTTTEEARGDAGDILWRFGCPSNYASSRQLGDDAKVEFPNLFDAEYTQLWGAHDAHWIGEGLPGEGHILIYNNGQGRVGPSYSDVFEINPFDENGNFVRELDAGYGTTSYASGSNSGGGTMSQTTRRNSNLIVWGFTGGQFAMYAQVVSGAQRFPNGNTLICACASGHVFEVTKDGEVVWEYLLPLFGGYYTTNAGIDADGEAVTGAASPSKIFRAYRFTADFPGLKGRNLVPMGKLEEPEKWQFRESGNYSWMFNAAGGSGGSSAGASGSSSGGGY